MKIQLRTIFAAAILAFVGATDVKAQAGNFGTAYFQNQFILNPAMAGLKNGELNLNTAYNGETAGISNGAQTLSFTADYGLKEVMGLGVGVMMDKIGGINTTKLMASYTYGLKLNSDNQRLNFGLSAGGVMERLDELALSGDLSDPNLYNFNNDRMQFEADLGASYFNKGVTFQVAAPNLVSTLRKTGKTILSQNTFFASVGYKFSVGESKSQINIEPKVAFRGVKGLDDIVDAGANVDFLENTVNVFGLYHSSKSLTAGFGVKVLDAFQIAGSYNFGNENIGGINSGNTYEIGLRFFTTKK